MAHMPDTEKLREAFRHLREARRALETTFPLLTESEHGALWDKVQVSQSQLDAAIADIQHRLYLIQRQRPQRQCLHR